MNMRHVLAVACMTLGFAPAHVFASSDTEPSTRSKVTCTTYSRNSLFTRDSNSPTTRLRATKQRNLPKAVFPASKSYTKGTTPFSILRASISRISHTYLCLGRTRPSASARPFREQRDRHNQSRWHGRTSERGHR